MAVDRAPAGAQRGAVGRLELVELAGVQQPGQDLPGIERDAQVGNTIAIATLSGGVYSGFYQGLGSYVFGNIPSGRSTRAANGG